jgi:hypothetical protein
MSTLTAGSLKLGMKMLLRSGRAMMAVEKPNSAFSSRFLLNISKQRNNFFRKVLNED